MDSIVNSFRSILLAWKSLLREDVARKAPVAGKRWHQQARARIERQRDDAVGQLRHAGDVGVEIDPLDEGDQAQASERLDLGFMTRERLADRVNRLTAALERMNEGTYRSEEHTCELQSHSFI